MKGLVDECKLKLVDIKPEQAMGYDLVELKYDGWWALVNIHDGIGEIWSAGGDMRGVTPAPPDINAVVIGEWMYGTTWSKHYNPGVVFLHDIVSLDGVDLRDQAYSDRRKILDRLSLRLPNTHFRIVVSYPASEWQRLIREFCDGDQEFEGVVFKHRASRLRQYADVGRIKVIPTIDYVCLGFVPGKGRHQGRLGALIGGIYVNNAVNYCRVGGGFTDEQRIEIWENRANYKMKVFEASGRRLYESGALRHPNFVRWRDDKLPHECIMQRRMG